MTEEAQYDDELIELSAPSTIAYGLALVRFFPRRRIVGIGVKASNLKLN